MPGAVLNKPATAPDGTLRGDIFLLHGMIDDTYSKILSLIQFVQGSQDKLTQLTTDLTNIKAAATQALSELTLVHAQAEDNNSDLEALQQTIESSVAITQENTKQYNQILKDITEILRDLFQDGETIKAAIVGVSQHMREHPCPWTQGDDNMSGEERMEAMDAIILNGPKIEMLVEHILDREGYELSPDGKYRRKWWLKRDMDRLREAFITVIFTMAATGLLGWAALRVGGYLSPGKDQQLQQLQQQVEQMQRTLNEKDNLLVGAQAELSILRKRSPK